MILASYRENCETRVYFIAYSEEKFISQFLLDHISAESLEKTVKTSKFVSQKQNKKIDVKQ